MLLSKIYIPISVFILICTLFLFYFLPDLSGDNRHISLSPGPALSAVQTNLDEDLITLLENAQSPEERKKILEDNREKLDSSSVISLLVKADGSTAGKTLSKARSKHLVQIAIEVSEFTGDNTSLAKALSYNSFFEEFDKKNYTSPGLQKSLRLFIEARDRKGEASCYYYQAKNLYMNTGEMDKAMEILDKSIKICDETDDEILRGDCYFLKGRIYENEGYYDRSAENTKKALEIYKNRGDIMSVLSCYKSLADLCRAGGSLNEAFEYLETERKTIDGLETDKIKDFSGKEEGYLFRKTAEIKSKEKLMMNYYNDTGYLYYMTGKYEQAIKSLKNAIEPGKKLEPNINPEVIVTYWSMGNLYLCIGQKDMALKYYLEAMDRDKDNLSIPLVIGNYKTLGNFYLWEMKQHDKALNCYESALKKSEEIEDNERKNIYRASCLTAIGKTYEERCDFDRAIEKMEEARKLYEQSDDDFDRMFIYDRLGEAYQKKGEKEKALTCYNKALEYAKQSKVSDLISSAYNYLGDFYFETEKYDMAKKAYINIINTEKEAHNISLMWAYYYSLGKTCEKQGNLQEAYNAYDNSIKIIENMRQELRVDEFKRDFLKDKIEVYEHMIHLLIKMHREKDAFIYNEKARARAFLDILANQKIDIHHGVSKDLITKEEEVKTRIQHLSGNIRDEKEKPAVAQRNAFILETDGELGNLKREYEQILKQIKLENPEYMTLISVNPLSLKQIQSLLDKDTVIIEYFLGDTDSYAWVTGHDTFNTISLNHNRKDIESLVRSYRETACEHMTPEKIKSDTWKDTSKKLYDILFKEAEKYTSGKKRILISPHRILNYLPFQVLSDGEGNMLVEKFEISYLPSASILKYCRDKNPLKKESLLAFEPGDLKVDNLSPLEGAKKEVNSIAAMFSRKEILAGKDMRTDTLYKDGKNYDILHFATHGILDSSSPLF
ncbi:MAG: tetratricopeptide repeat protein, partial [Candidatus Eremiobacterota bacterium]